MWLEDDAVLHTGWSVVMEDTSKLMGCMTALHKCNCHSCNAQGVYNGVGMVAVLFERTRLLLLLARIKEWPEEGALTALDTRVYQVCGKGEHGLEQAHYFRPMDELATNQGDIARTSTKPPQQMRVVLTFPAAGQVRLHCCQCHQALLSCNAIRALLLFMLVSFLQKSPVKIRRENAVEIR